MRDTIAAIAGVILAPTISTYIPMPGGFIGEMLFSKIILFLIVLGITIVTSIFRSLNYCRTKDGKFKSFGLNSGIKRGIFCSTTALATYIASGFIPVLKVPFMALSFIPVVGTMVDGMILATGYLFGFMTTYMIWGVC